MSKPLELQNQCHCWTKTVPHCRSASGSGRPSQAEVEVYAMAVDMEIT